jgi:hypothetical protein
MAATLTKTCGPSNIGEGFKMATYSVAFDSAQAAGGESIDLTGEFDYVYAVIPGGNDTAADNGYIARAVVPGATTAVTSSNVLIQLLWNGGDSGEVMLEFTGNASAIGAMQLLVIGK